MKKSLKKDGATKGVAKGGPSGVVISLALHAAAFLLAGLLVVFTVANKEEKQFTPPKPVDRPKMKLKKPKVKVKKNTKPKSTTRIVTKVNKASMPDIQLPEMSGVGDGLGDVGGFDFGDMPNIEALSQFGNKESVGSDLEGTFYDFNRNRSGADVVTAPLQLADLIDKFFRRGWDTSVFNRYYRAPKKLYASAIAMPPLQSGDGPPAFGEETYPWCWLVHYKGQLVHHEDIKFRFWGFGDDITAVRVNGKIVMLSCFPQWVTEFEEATAHHWQSSSADNKKYPLSNHHAIVGDWIELKANEPQDIEILIGESAGGIFSAMLLVQVEGVEYEKNPHRFGPCLPFFKTTEFTQDMVEIIYSQLQPGEATCEMGPVFNDYDSIGATQRLELVYTDEPAPPPPPLAANTAPEARAWSTTDGKNIQATYKTLMGKSAVLEIKKGKQVPVPMRDLSEEDQRYVMLQNPPTFDIELFKTSDQIPPAPVTIWLDYAEQSPLQYFEWQFGARLKQTSAYEGYELPLKIEFFVFGEEVDGDNYVLLDRHSETLTPSKDGDRLHEILSPRQIETRIYAIYGDNRGTKYGGYLVTITDELGRITQYRATHEWLYKNLENLKDIPLGKHFNKNCNRVMPARPQEKHRCPWN